MTTMVIPVELKARGLHRLDMPERTPPMLARPITSRPMPSIPSKHCRDGMTPPFPSSYSTMAHLKKKNSYLQQSSHLSPPYLFPRQYAGNHNSRHKNITTTPSPTQQTFPPSALVSCLRACLVTVRNGMLNQMDLQSDPTGGTFLILLFAMIVKNGASIYRNSVSHSTKMVGTYNGEGYCLYAQFVWLPPNYLVGCYMKQDIELSV